MKKILISVCLALLLAALFLPTTALAATKHSVKISGVKSSYTVASVMVMSPESISSTLTVSGHLYSSFHDNSWTSHDAKLSLQRFDSTAKVWRTLKTVRPSRWGWFTVSKSAANTGSYRIHYNGCRHFSAKNVYFQVVRPDYRVEPQLTVTGAATIMPGVPQPTSAQMVPGGIRVDGTVSSALSYWQLAGGTAAITVRGSMDNITFSDVTTMTLQFDGAPLSFNYTVPVVPQPSSVNPAISFGYRYFKIEVNWSGNNFTKAGVYSSDVFNAVPLEKLDPNFTATIDGASQLYPEYADQYIVDLSGDISCGIDYWKLGTTKLDYAMQESSDGVTFYDRIMGQVAFAQQPYHYTFSAAFTLPTPTNPTATTYFRTRMTWPGNEFTNPTVTYSPVVQIQPPSVPVN